MIKNTKSTLTTLPANAKRWYLPETDRQKYVPTIIPVSYTHLDVYKRQGMDWPRNKAINASGIRRQQKELCDILDRLKAANFNTVLLQTVPLRLLWKGNGETKYMG